MPRKPIKYFVSDGGIVEFSFTKDKIILNNKVVNRLDEFVLKFTSILDNMKINYVIVSGYVAIVFGRSSLRTIDSP